MMLKLKIFVFCISFFFILQGCGKQNTPSYTGKSEKKDFNTTEYERYYVEGVTQKITGNTGDALRYFEMCIRLNPASDAPYYHIAQILAASGDNANAKKYARTAAENDVKNLWYMMMLSQLYYQEKNIDSAVIWHEKAVKAYPENENLQLTMGDLYIESRQYDKANAIFDNLDKKYGVNETSTVSSIRSLISAGKNSEARAKVLLLLEKNPDDILFNGLLAEVYRSEGNKEMFIETYENLLLKNPSHAQLQLGLAEFLADEKLYDQLFPLLNSIILNDNVRKEEKVSLFARLLDSYDQSVNNNSLSLTLMLLEAAYKDDPIIPLLRTELLLKSNKIEEATNRLEELVKQNPENYYAWEKLLFVFLEKKDFEKLTVAGAECATRFNTSFMAKILYATGATETSRFEVALNELRKAEILAGEDHDMLTQVLNMRADVYYKSKDYSKAFSTYEEAIKLNPDDLTLQNNYAYYLAEQDLKLKEAEIMARYVTEKEPNATYLDTYGWVLYKRGKLNEAAKVFESIIETGSSQDAEWWEHYGFVLSGQKKFTKAVDAWKKAIQLDPAKTHLNKEIENCAK